MHVVWTYIFFFNRVARKVYVCASLFVLTQMLLSAWYLFLKDNTIHWRVTLQQNNISATALQTINSAEDSYGDQYKRKFKGLDYQDLQQKVSGTIRRNLHVRIIQKEKSKDPFVTLKYTNLSFSKIINVSPKTKQEYPFKTYAFVHTAYNDQLSKNTRALLSLCVQAGQSGRHVVRPSVKSTKFSSSHSWLHLETYYNVTHLNNLLLATGYTSLVDKQEYLKECPSNSSNHVSIHFIESSKTSLEFTRRSFRIEENHFNSILQNSTGKGWAECPFLDRAMGRTPGKQFCINSAIIKDWKVLEKDIVKHAKCLNIFQWRGTEGSVYRLKFREYHLEFSSLDLTFNLKPGLSVMREVERFRKESLAGDYIALYMRSEKIKPLERIYQCVDLMLQVCPYLRFEII